MWLQVLIFNSNISIQHYSFICMQSNGLKYCYPMPIVQLLLTIKRFQLFYSNSFVYKKLNGPKYGYVIPI